MFTDKYEPMFYDTKHLTVTGYYKFGEYLNLVYILYLFRCGKNLVAFSDTTISI